MSDFILAQLNLATLLYPLESPEMADFVNSLDNINSLAERSTGFVWRLQTEDGDATAIRHFGDNVIVNMSTWRSVETLQNFVYHSEHVHVLKRRREWFSQMKTFSVLWWTDATTEPSLNEAAQRLALLQSNGPSERAFTFQKNWPAPSVYRPPSSDL